MQLYHSYCITMHLLLAYLQVFANVMDPLQLFSTLWKELHNRLCENYTHRGVPVERAYLEGLADIHFVLRWHGLTLSNFNLPKQEVPVPPETKSSYTLLTMSLKLFAKLPFCAVPN